MPCNPANLSKAQQALATLQQQMQAAKGAHHHHGGHHHKAGGADNRNRQRVNDEHRPDCVDYRPQV